MWIVKQFNPNSQIQNAAFGHNGITWICIVLKIKVIQLDKWKLQTCLYLFDCNTTVAQKLLSIETKSYYLLSIPFSDRSRIFNFYTYYSSTFTVNLSDFQKTPFSRNKKNFEELAKQAICESQNKFQKILTDNGRYWTALMYTWM